MSPEGAEVPVQRRWEAGDLSLSSGLLVILDLALSSVSADQEVVIESSDLSGVSDVRSWCKFAGHHLTVRQGNQHSIEYTICKGPAQQLLLDSQPLWGIRAPLNESGEFKTRLLSAMTEVPDLAGSERGFAPRGAALELHSPGFPFTLNDKNSVWATEIADLYDQAVANQWDASRDIPWNQLPELPEIIERSVCQVMTFLIENEYSALYVPGKFISRINPQYMEVVLFLSTQLMDESRHIEAFTKRALANGGGLQVCTASTEHSLKSLFEQNDFSCASFLLSVLGEGTFLDLLKFIEEVAPDPVTEEIARRARIDETRHVHFGMAHIRLLLSEQSEAADKLIEAVRERARVLNNVTSINELVTRSLIVLAGGGISPEQLKVGTEKVSGLLKLMDENRRKRLTGIGFSEAQSLEISRLHTPNFM